MKKNNLEKLNIDFLYYEKERKKTVIIKLCLTVLLISLIVFTGVSYIVKTKQLNHYKDKIRKIDYEINMLNDDISRKGKKIKFYLKNRKKIVDILNSFIDKKGYPIKEDIKFIKENGEGLTIVDFSLREDFSIKLNVSSNNFNNLISFKRYLEKRFIVKIGSDEKKNGIYYQTIYLKKRENE